MSPLEATGTISTFHSIRLLAVNNIRACSCTESTTLLLQVNAVRRALWHAKLGIQKKYDPVGPGFIWVPSASLISFPVQTCISRHSAICET
jgi:hypothetical protein